MPNAVALRSRPWSAGNGLRDAETTAFLSWLFCWIILPNLPFLPITLMGGPPRFPEILVCGVVGLVARRWNYGARVATFMALLAYMTISFVSRMFNMAISMIMSVIGLVLDMQPAVSLEYVVGALLLACCCAAGIWSLRQKGDFKNTRLLLCAIGSVLALAAADYAISRDTMGSYSRLAPAGAPFTSATRQTNLLGLADGTTNVLIVMVEAMGQPTDPTLRNRFDRIWQRPELAERFDISHGETAFYGSTTSGEMRELCQRWGNYDEITGPDASCLPALLEKRGYQTTSYHAFVPDFFNRDQWYPLIGFQNRVFAQDLLDQGASYCPNVFPGACDRDIPAIIAKKLKQAHAPQFVYWLTLNSHLPIVENHELGTENCSSLGPQLDADFPMICRLFTIWGSTADALVKVVERPDFPPTHILIVGDHMPPFTHQKSRLQFDPAHVPWVLLRSKGAATSETAPSLQSPRAR